MSNHLKKNKKTSNMSLKEKKENQGKEKLVDNPTSQSIEEEKQEEENKSISQEVNSQEEELAQQLEEANTKIEENNNQYLRLSAEFDNYRKRTMKEKAELIKNGGERAITAILPILDDLERAIQTMETSTDMVGMKEGIELIYNKFLKIISQEGVIKMETKDQDFNTDYHEAIALVPAPDESLKGKILDCVQTGYLLNDKVIRHAKVVIGE
ncbi:MAG: nucleotide exchange factor GrpE [Bacteroidaceae bacterium]